MSEIIKTEAIVLSKINYSESSLIVSLYTLNNGLISVILKGGRRPKSKIASVVDVLNHIQAIIYKKETREVQLLSSADLISHFPKIKSDLNSLQYAYATCELIKTLLAEHEVNEKIFNGLVRILTLMNNKQEHPAILFGRFFIFFLKEIGYELNLETCEVCAKPLTLELKPSLFSNEGFICINCKETNLNSRESDSELFNYLFCLKNKKNNFSNNEKLFQSGIQFLISYSKNHIETFKGLNSLSMF